MLSIMLLLILSACLYSALKKALQNNVIAAKMDHEAAQEKNKALVEMTEKLRQDNSALEESLLQVVELYDITKEICKSLDFEEVFRSFKKQIALYIKVKDCLFLKSDADASAYKDYTLFPLKIGNALVGYLGCALVNGDDQDKFRILANQFMLGIKRATLYQRVSELAITDRLTQVFTRRYFLERFGEEFQRSLKSKYSFSFLMIDIDHFKKCNDRYGHLVGDAILKEVAKTVKENTRQIDILGRYGGEEFAVVLSETDREQAKFAAGRIREAVLSKVIRIYDEELKVTISIGVSTFPQDADEIQSVIDKADSALYKAKQSGRNKVCIFGDIN